MNDLKQFERNAPMASYLSYVDIYLSIQDQVDDSIWNIFLKGAYYVCSLADGESAPMLI